MRGGINSLVNRAASLIRASATPGVAAPRCAPASPPTQASQQAPHRALHSFIWGRGSGKNGTPTFAELPCPHETSAKRCVTVVPAAHLAQRVLCSASAAAVLQRSGALSSKSGLSSASQTASQAGLHSSAAAHDDDDRGQRGKLQSEVRAAKQQLQQAGATPASSASAGSSNDGATFMAHDLRRQSFEGISILKGPLLHCLWRGVDAMTEEFQFHNMQRR